MQSPRCWGSLWCWPLQTTTQLFFLLPPNTDAASLSFILSLPSLLTCITVSPPSLSSSTPPTLSLSQKLPITSNANPSGFSSFFITLDLLAAYNSGVLPIFEIPLPVFSLLQFLSQPLSFPHQILLLPHVGAILLSALSSLLSFTRSLPVEWPLIGLWPPSIYSLSFDCKICFPLENHFSCFMSPCWEWKTRCLYFF